jgi:hypothetical protein
LSHLYPFIVRGEETIQFDQNFSEVDERGVESFLYWEDADEALDGEAELYGSLRALEGSRKPTSSRFDIGPGDEFSTFSGPSILLYDGDCTWVVSTKGSKFGRAPIKELLSLFGRHGLNRVCYSNPLRARFGIE